METVRELSSRKFEYGLLLSLPSNSSRMVYCNNAFTYYYYYYYYYSSFSWIFSHLPVIAAEWSLQVMFSHIIIIIIIIINCFSWIISHFPAMAAEWSISVMRL